MQKVIQNLNGIIHISGGVGVGKTALALELAGEPKNITYINFDVKKPQLYNQFAKYLEYGAELTHGTLLDMITSFLKEIKSLNPTKFLIIESWELAYRALIPYIMKNAHNMTTAGTIFGAGEWANRQKYGYRSYFETGIFATLQSKFEHVIITTHMDYMHENQIKTSKRVPVASDVLKQKTVLRLLLQGDGNSCPNAIVLKNFSVQQVVDHGEYKRIESVPALPPKVSISVLGDTSNRNYVSLWDAISYYVNNPLANRSELEEFEVLTEYEDSLKNETLTDEERQYVLESKRMLLLSEHAEYVNILRGLDASELAKAPPILRKYLSEQYELDIPTEILAALLPVVKNTMTG